MANSNSCLSLFIFLAISSLSQHSCSHDFPPWTKHQAPLFIFGDSLLDVGTNNYINSTTTTFQANFWPYGETFFKYPTGRWSDGRMVPDFIAEYANLPFLLPFLHPGNKHYINGVNFASGGSGTLDETFQGFVLNLHSQLSHFNKVERILSKQLGKKEAKALLSRAVYLISAGSNDYSFFVGEPKLLQTHSLQEYVDMVIGNLTTAIKEIHKKGGRKFAVVNAGAMNRIPTIKAALISESKEFRVEDLEPLAKLHNKQLHKTLPKLKRELKGFVYSHIDIYNIFNGIIENPAKYGLKEVEAGCCGSGKLRGTDSCGGKRGIKEYELCKNPENHMFFDSVHISERGSQIVSELIWNGNSDSVTPINVKSLFLMQ